MKALNFVVNIVGEQNDRLANSELIQTTNFSKFNF